MAVQTQSGRNFKNIKHVGNIPKNDQDNICREKLCELVRDVGCFHELCPEKFYLINLAKDEDARLFCEHHSNDPKSPFIFWGLHDHPSLVYEAFNMDFGPFNLAATHQFCSQIKVWLDTQAYRDPDKCILVVLDDRDTKRKLNATLLVAIAAMVLLNLTDQEVIQRLDFFMMHKGTIGVPKKELVFREKKKFTDVSGNQSVMSLTLEDCIKAFHAAIQNKFYNYYEFDHAEYLFYETVMSGDLNWIVPGKLLAFAGPSDKPVFSKIYHKHPPQFYYHYFKDHNVSTIVRLNEPEYLSDTFIEQGFDHRDLIFPDGYPPTSTTAARFIRLVDDAQGAVAVHCYAGIGRTGTLIAAYLVARYDFTPQMAIAWTRICRPGSVIGEQQDWLFTKFDQYSINKTPTRPIKSRKTKSSQSVEPVRENVTVEPESKIEPTTYAAAEKTYGQAKALLLAKKQRENSDRPCTRNSTLLKSLDTIDAPKSSKGAKKTDLVLDLGKTVPLMINLADFKNLKSDQLPKFYRLNDGKYEWKVKFPQPSYVTIKHDFERDIEMALRNNLKLESIYRDPILDFRHESEGEPPNLEGNKIDNTTQTVPKHKPIVYLSLLSVCSEWKELLHVN